MWLPNKEKVSLKLHFKLKGGGEKRGKWRKEMKKRGSKYKRCDGWCDWKRREIVENECANEVENNEYEWIIARQTIQSSSNWNE